jgi:hypothetical protein
MAKHRRVRSTDRNTELSATHALPLALADVYLLTAESDGQLAIGNLTLVLDDEGLTVLAPDGSSAAGLTWPELTSLRTTGRTTGPGGERAVVLEAASEMRTHRFVVPTRDAPALETTIASLTGATVAEPARRARRRR